MKTLYTMLFAQIASWSIYLPFISIEQSWYIVLTLAYVRIALVMQLLWTGYEKTFRNEAIVSFCLLGAIVDYLCFIAWTTFEIPYANIFLIAILFLVWFIWICLRAYNTDSDKITSNVMILLLKPNKWYKFVLSFIGLPYSSICICAGGYVWSFRKKAGTFQKTLCSTDWLKTHLILDTGVKNNRKIISALTALQGSKRQLPIKCVYVLRNVLAILGDKWAVKSWYEYSPAILAFRYLRNRGKH